MEPAAVGRTDVELASQPAKWLRLAKSGLWIHPRPDTCTDSEIGEVGTGGGITGWCERCMQPQFALRPTAFFDGVDFSGFWRLDIALQTYLSFMAGWPMKAARPVNGQ